MGKIYIVAYIVYLTVMILLIYQSLSYEIEVFLGLLGLLIGTSMVLFFMSFYMPRKKK
jgi:multisubunit Na+/H+ antiporter MnhE subunit